jgi:RNA polymerase sigma-70 factor (ECF subfamily)
VDTLWFFPQLPDGFERSEFLNLLDSPQMSGNPESGEITRLLQEVRLGSRDSADRLIPLVYDELHRLARRYLGHERPDHTLQATALVNEAYIRLMGSESLQCADRNHFFAISATVMRRILVDHAKRRQSDKRGRGVRHVSLDEVQLGTVECWDQILAVDEALSRLGEIHSRCARVVEMRFFSGLQIDEIAGLENIATKTVRRDLDFAQSWLYAEMFPEQNSL